jgi:hypothetical protein
MYMTLTVIAAAIGLIAFGSIVGIVWRLLTPKRGESKADVAERLRKRLMHWSFFDYTVVLLFLFGMVFLLADLSAVLRDREAYPLYHFGYLASGFVFCLLAMLFVFVRLGLTLSAVRASSAPEHEHDQPADAHHPEQGV